MATSPPTVHLHTTPGTWGQRDPRLALQNMAMTTLWIGACNFMWWFPVDHERSHQIAIDSLSWLQREVEGGSILVLEKWYKAAGIYLHFQGKNDGLRTFICTPECWCSRVSSAARFDGRNILTKVFFPLFSPLHIYISGRFDWFHLA